MLVLVKPYETNCDLCIWATHMKFDWLIDWLWVGRDVSISWRCPVFIMSHMVYSKQRKAKQVHQITQQFVICPPEQLLSAAVINSIPSISIPIVFIITTGLTELKYDGYTVPGLSHPPLSLLSPLFYPSLLSPPFLSSHPNRSWPNAESCSARGFFLLKGSFFLSTNCLLVVGTVWLSGLNLTMLSALR